MPLIAIPLLFVGAHISAAMTMDGGFGAGFVLYCVFNGLFVIRYATVLQICAENDCSGAVFVSIMFRSTEKRLSFLNFFSFRMTRIENKYNEQIRPYCAKHSQFKMYHKTIRPT